jgi:phytoene desaturase
LAKDGHEVTVLEKNEQAGGRASVYSEDGYSFDMGPSWYLMPDVYERYFAEFDKKPEDLFELKRLDPSYRMFFSDDRVVDISADVEKNFELFDSLEKDGGEKLRGYLEQSREKYDTAVKELIYRDYRSILDFFDRKLLRGGMDLNILENLDEFVNKTFESDYARKIVEYSIGFLGGSPRITPAFYSIMTHIDFDLGVWYPIGGMRKVVEEMKRLAESQGTVFEFERPVTGIRVEGKHATGLETENGLVEGDAFLVNADYAHSELDLLDKHHRTYNQKYWENRVVAPSGFVAYLGVDTEVESLVHHNLFIKEDWINGFDELFDPSRMRWPETPSYYVNIPSKTDPTAAPRGCDTLFVLVPIAAGLEDTPEIREGFLDRILDDLESTTGESIRDHIQLKRIFAVDDFRERYNAYKGTALGLVHTLRQTAMWRPVHQSKKVKNLFYTGQYCHPGIGVPMTLISSQIVADEISDYKG